MKVKPIVMTSLRTNHTSFEVDLELDHNITFINGDSGTGKSAVYSFVQEMSTEDTRIRCYNFLDQKKAYKTAIKNAKGKLFVIDNADILLNDAMRRYIAFDSKNQYVIIGRDPTGLQLSTDDIMELQSESYDGKTKFSLIHSF